MAALNRLYGVGDGVGEAFSFFVVEVSAFLVVSVDVFLVVSVVVDFLVVSVDAFFVVEDFFIVFVEAGDFSGAGAVVDVSVLLVHEAMSPAASMTVME